MDIGLKETIEPQENYVRAKFIEERIDELLVEENFFLSKYLKNQSKIINWKMQLSSRKLRDLLSWT